MSAVPESQSGLARQLVQAFAGIHSTEDLIFFVAGSDHMLALCRVLIEQYDQDRSAPLVLEVNRYCAAQGVLAGALYGEVRKVLLALNRFHDAGGDHYAVLGLEPGASGEKVKQAYRELSKKYHPDRQHGAERDAKRFMEITGAYHAIMAATAEGGTQTATTWRKRHAHRPGRRPRDQKIFFSGIVVLVVLLAATSLYISAKHHQKVLLDQLRTNRTPPEQSMEESPNQVGQAVPPRPSDAVYEPSAPAPELILETRAAHGDATAPPEPAIEVAGDHALPAGPDDPLPLPRTMQPAVPVPDSPPPSARPLPSEAEPARTGVGTGTETSVARPREEPSAQELQEKENRIRRINTSLEISTLIKRYCTLYSDRDLSPFLTMFADHAEENGRLLTDLTDKYRSLFAHTRTIDLNINDITWNEDRRGFQARGKFNAAYTYTDGKSLEHRGQILFLMIREQGELKIKSLDYEFE